MDYALGRLEQVSVLSRGDIEKLRTYIAGKYENQTKVDRAQVLANALHRVVDRSLEGIDGAYWQAIKTHLFSSTLAAGKEGISQRDVFDEVYRLDLPSEALKDTAVRWIASHAPDLQSYMDLSAYTAWKVRTKAASESTQWVSDVLSAYPPVDLERHESSLLEQWLSRGLSLKPLGKVAAFAVMAALLYGPVAMPGTSFELNDRELEGILQPKRVAPITQHAIAASKPIVPAAKPIASTSHQEKPAPKVLTPTIQHEKPTVKREPAKAAISSPAPKVKLKSKALSTTKVLGYKSFDERALLKLLKSKNSLLAEEPYFSTIIDTAERNGVDPLLLFAITGQELSYVDRNSSHAHQKANNPFNIFGSWHKYNSTIEDSSQIVCNTINNRMKKWNGKGSAIAHIGRIYADDPAWAARVRGFYVELSELCRKGS